MYSNSNGIKNWFSGFGVGKGQTPLSAMRQVFVHFLNSIHTIVVFHFCCMYRSGKWCDKVEFKGIDASFPLSQCSFLCLLPLQHFILCLLIRPETKLLITSTLWKDVMATQVRDNKSELICMFTSIWNFIHVCLIPELYLSVCFPSLPWFGNQIQKDNNKLLQETPRYDITISSLEWDLTRRILFANNSRSVGELTL